jgi:hypothetical protein
MLPTEELLVDVAIHGAHIWGLLTGDGSHDRPLHTLQLTRQAAS